MTSFLVAIVPHRALLADRLDSFISILKEAGFTLLNQSHCLLTSKQAASLLDSGVEDDLNLFVEGTPACALHLSLAASNAYSVFDSLRPQLDCVYGSTSEWIAQRDEAAFFPSPSYFERAVIAVKPKYSDALYEAVHAMLDQHDFIVLGKVAKILSEEEAREFSDHTSESLAHWTSDVSVFIAVERMNCTRHLQSLIGPDDPVVARQYAPSTLRAQFGASLVENSVYSSGSFLQAERDLKLMFPSPFALQHTLAVIRPEGMSASQQFLNSVKEQGFVVTAQSVLIASRTRAENLYKDHATLPYYEQLVLSLTQGTCMAFCLTKSQAVDHLNRMMGPTQYTQFTSPAARFPDGSLQSLMGAGDVLHPGLYVSETPASALRDVKEWFPNIVDDSLLFDETPTLAPGSALNNVLIEGLTALCKAKPAKHEAVQWFADWLIQHNPNKPKVSEPVVEKPVEKPAIKAIFCVDPDDQAFTQLVGQSASTSGYECIDVKGLVDHAALHDKQHGPLITEQRALMRPIPSSVVVAIIERAIRASANTKFLVSGFPANLELALEFESKICKPFACVTNFSNTEKKRDDEEQAVIDHYQVFKQLRVVRDDAHIATVFV